MDASSEQKRIEYFDKALNARVLDLTAAHQHDVNMFLLARLNNMAPAKALDVTASMDTLMVCADASMGHGAGHGVHADFYVNVAVEGASGAAGALADTPITRGIGVYSIDGGSPVAGHAETRHRVGECAKLMLRASADCYAYVFHMGPDGKPTALVPSLERPSADNKLRGGVVRFVPQPGDTFEFKFEPPAGLDTVYVVATREPWPEPWLTPFQADGGDETRSRAVYRTLARYLDAHARDRGLATCLHKFETYNAA